MKGLIVMKKFIELLAMDMKILVKNEYSIVKRYSLEDLDRFLFLNFAEKIEILNHDNKHLLLSDVHNYFLSL